VEGGIAFDAGFPFDPRADMEITTDVREAEAGNA